MKFIKNLLIILTLVLVIVIVFFKGFNTKYYFSASERHYLIEGNKYKVATINKDNRAYFEFLISNSNQIDYATGDIDYEFSVEGINNRDIEVLIDGQSNNHPKLGTIKGGNFNIHSVRVELIFSDYEMNKQNFEIPIRFIAKSTHPEVKEEVFECLVIPEEKFGDYSGNDITINVSGTQMKIDEEKKFYLEFDYTDYIEIDDFTKKYNLSDGFNIDYKVMWYNFNEFSRIFDFTNVEKKQNINLHNFSNTNKIEFSFLKGKKDWDNYTCFLYETEIKEYDTKKIKIEKTDGYYQLQIKELIDDKWVDSTNCKFKTDEAIFDGLIFNNYIGRSNKKDGQHFRGRLYELKITDLEGKDVLWLKFDK